MLYRNKYMFSDATFGPLGTCDVLSHMWPYQPGNSGQADRHREEPLKNKSGEPQGPTSHLPGPSVHHATTLDRKLTQHAVCRRQAEA